MHIFERCFKAIRHSYFLEQANWLWDYIRPLYDKILPLLSGNRGIERIINGTDRIFVPVQFRSLPESYESRVWKYIMEQVRPGDIVADVGAFIGLYTVAFARRVGPLGKVFAFEPDPDNFMQLKRITECNKGSSRIELFELAVGSKDGTVSFSAGLLPGSHIDSVPKYDAYTVRCVSLDTFFGNQRLDILKVDVEGFEEEVLKGCIDILSDYKRSPRCILLEVHPCFWSHFGTSAESLINLIRKYRYSISNLNGQFVKMPDWWGWIICTK